MAHTTLLQGATLCMAIKINWTSNKIYVYIYVFALYDQKISSSMSWVGVVMRRNAIFEVVFLVFRFIQWNESFRLRHWESEPHSLCGLQMNNHSYIFLLLWCNVVFDFKKVIIIDRRHMWWICLLYMCELML